MMKRHLVAAAVAAFAVLATVVPARAALAQGQAVAERDAAELKSYRLTMDKIRKLADAGAAIAKAAEADPRYKAEQDLKKEIAALEKKDELSEAEEKKLEDLRTKLEELGNKSDDDSGNAQTLDEMARRIEKIPAMANAIRSLGLTPREYFLVSLATFQAMMAHGFQKAAGGAPLPKEVAATVLAENIKFIADNEAEITRVMERLKALEKKPER